MNRRQYLTGTAVATAGIAGCTGFLKDSPDEVVEQFYQAVDDGDRETANGFIHSDSPQGELSADDMSEFENMSITVDKTEVVNESDDVAEVKTEITIEQDGESFTQEMTYELRTEGGSWKLYE